MKVFFIFFAALLEVVTGADCSSLPSTGEYTDNIIQGIETANCDTIPGNVIIKGTSLNWPKIIKIGGNLKYDNKVNMKSVTMNALKTIGGDMEIDTHQQISSVSMNALETVGGDMKFYSNDNLKTFSMNALKTVKGNMEFKLLKKLDTLSMNALETVGAFFLLENANILPTLNIPKLKTVGGETAATDKYLKITQNYKLETLSMNALETVGGETEFLNNAILKSLSLNALKTVGDKLYFSSLLMLKTLTLPEVVTVVGMLQVDTNNVFDVTMPKLKTVGSLVVKENDKLETFSVNALETVGGKMQFRLNKNLGMLFMNALKTIGGDTTATDKQMEFDDNAKLEIVSMKALKSVGKHILFKKMSALGKVNIPSLTTYGFLSASTNSDTNKDGMQFLLNVAFDQTGKGTEQKAAGKGLTDSTPIVTTTSPARTIQYVVEQSMKNPGPCKEVYGISLHEGATDVYEFPKKSCDGN